jgi:DNA-binding NarL/FixJ family response regulator
MKKLRVFITDDHQMLRSAWTFYINNNPLFEVVGEAGCAETALQKIKALLPDIVLMDINLPCMNGIEATEQIMTIDPSIKIIGCSSHKNPDFARKMMRKGAMGYVSKFAPLKELTHALSEISQGRKYMCNSIKEVLAEEIMNNSGNENKMATLTSRELDVIEEIKKGKSSKEIAAALYLSTNTIEVHRYNILKKLNLPNRAALVNYIHMNLMTA